MKLIFNDATEIIVQQVESHGDYLRILTVGNTPEQLKVLFTDQSRTVHMIVQERGQTVAAHEGYTAFYRTEIYTGKIYGVVMYKQETLEKGYKFVHGDVLYKTIQDSLLIQEQYVPGEGTESLYAVIDETHAGTQENPIPYDGNMALEKGKYYSQDGVIYLCNRDTENPVYHNLSDLIGLYVEKATE